MCESRRLVPGDAPGDQEGEDRRRRGQHHGGRCRHILLRPGDHQERNRRIDGLLLGEQLPGFRIGWKPHPAGVEDNEQEKRGDQRARRDESDRRDRAQPDLGQRIGRAPAARQRQQQRIIAPAAPRRSGLIGWWRRCCPAFDLREARWQRRPPPVASTSPA